MNPAAPLPPPDAAIYVPPRPNLGPDPIGPDAGSGAPGWALPLILLVVVVATGVIVARRSRRFRLCLESTPQLPKLESPGHVEAVRALSAVVRQALVARFGPDWWARTTEEIAADAVAEESLGREGFDRLITFLRLADRVKFAGANEAEAQGVVETWAGWVEAFLAAGASSTINGK